MLSFVVARADHLSHPATLLTSAQQLTASNRPSSSEYRSVCRYISQNKPLIPEELEYIQHKEDLVTLRPGRDHAWLDRSIERVLRLRLFSFLNVSTWHRRLNAYPAFVPQSVRW